MKRVPTSFKKAFRIARKGEKLPPQKMSRGFPDFKVFDTGKTLIGYRSPIGGAHGMLVPKERAESKRMALPQRGVSLAKREIRLDKRVKRELIGGKHEREAARYSYVTKKRENPWREIENTARAEKYFGDLALRVHGFEIDKTKNIGKIFFSRVLGKALSKTKFAKMSTEERIDVLSRVSRVMNMIHEGKDIEGKHLSMHMGDFSMKNVIWDESASNGVRLVDLENSTFQKTRLSMQDRLHDMLTFLGSAKFHGLVRNYYDVELFVIHYLFPKFKMGDKLYGYNKKKIIDLMQEIKSEVPQHKADKNIQNLAPLFS